MLFYLTLVPSCYWCIKVRLPATAPYAFRVINSHSSGNENQIFFMLIEGYSHSQGNICLTMTIELKRAVIWTRPYLFFIQKEEVIEEDSKHYRKRKIVSNWSRYDDSSDSEGGDDDIPLQRGEDFNKLLAEAGNVHVVIFWFCNKTAVKLS